MNNRHQSATEIWQAAAEYLKQNFKLEVEQLESNQEFQALNSEIKQIVIKLFTNKKSHHTLLDEPAANKYSQILDHDLSGQSIDSYQLVELIAHGGMSSVYRGRKAGAHSQKDVAIKLIPTNLQTTETIALFKRELDTLAQLHHPNIISMHHGDVAQSGTPFLVMELVENARQIDQYFNQQSTDFTSIIRQFITLCQVISYAHQNGVIHQDIKPSNVLMDEHGHLLVLDFGVAALTEVNPEHHAYTLSYAAPEQINKVHFPKPSFDTFAITSLLIKCLTQCSDHQTNWQFNALTRFKTDKDLKFILAKGIAKQASKRYQQADELAMDLNLWLKKLPVGDLKNNPWYRLKKTVSRHPAITVLTTFTLSAMVIGLIFYQQQYQRALSESIKAQQVKNILIDAIDQNDPDISKGNDLTVRDMLKRVELSYTENPTTDSNISKELLLTLAQAFNKLGDYESTEKTIQNLLAIDPTNSEALLELTELKTQQKQLMEANDLLIKLNLISNELSPEQNIRLYLISANIAVINNEFEEAEKHFLTAQLLSEQINQANLIIKVLAAHANGLLEQDKMDSAVERITEAVSMSESSFGSQHSTTLELKSKLAEIYLSYSGEKIELATALFAQIIPQQQALLGNDHPNVAKSLFLNATGLRSLNKMSEAGENAIQALNIAEQQLGSKHMFTGKVLMTLAAIYLAEKDFSKAVEYARKAVENHENQLGTDHPETLQYKTSYVAILVEDQQHEEALKILLQIHPIQTTKLGANHRGTLFVDIVLAKTYTAMGQLINGISAGERCMKNAQQSEDKNIMEVFCAITLENAYFLNQQFSQSKTLIEQYQNDPLVTSRANVKQQFQDHYQHILKVKAEP